ncbi:MAG: hypothetical protein ABF651_05520 [Sporolactobacillus sp.]
MIKKHQSAGNQKKGQDNFDRAFIGRLGCMGPLLIIAILIILYAIFIAK